MLNLSEEEIVEFLKESARHFQEDTQFLLDRGWIKTDEKEMEGESVNAVWICPTNSKKYVHQNSMVGSTKWTFAIDRAEYDLILEKGFRIIYIDDAKDKRWNRACFVHPVNKKIFTYDEAVECARYNNMNDLTDDQLCGKTLDFRKFNIPDIDEINYLVVDFVLKDNKHTYILVKSGKR